MAECQTGIAIRAQLAREEELSTEHVTHLGECASCTSLMTRAASLDSALARATRELVTVDLPAQTLEIARHPHNGSATRRPVVAAIAAAAMVVGLSAASHAGLLRPTFSDDALRTDSAAFAAFDECLDRAGYSPRPTATGPQSFSDELLAYQRAAMRCSVESGIGEVDGDDPAEVQWANGIATGITECLRDGGWDVPDPVLEPLGRYLVPPSGVVSDDPVTQSEFNRDLQACAAHYGIETDETDE